MSRPWSPGRVISRSTIAPVVVGIAVIVVALAGFFSAPIWLVVLVCATPWLVLLRNYFGVALAVCGVGLGSLLLALVLLTLTAVARAPMLLSVELAVSLLGLVGCAVWVSYPSTISISRRSVWSFAPALLGAAVWLIVATVNALRHPFAGLSWAMHGDDASYILYARTATASHGIVFGPSQNPVPLPSALLALFMAPNRARVSSSDLLKHDLVASESLQIAIIAASCILAGLLAGRLAQSSAPHPLVVAVASGAGSLLPLSWTVTTVALNYGYLDAELALPTVLACILVATRSHDHPLATLGLLACGCTVLLAVWSPLAVVPVGLMGVVFGFDHSGIYRARGRALAFLVVSGGLLLLYGLGVALPRLIELRASLTLTGAVYRFTPTLFPSLGCVTVLLALPLWRLAGRRLALTVAVVPLALGVGLAVLLFPSRNSSDPWTYFPSKFAWLSIAILLVIVLGLLPTLLVPWFARRSVRLIAASSMLSMAAIVFTSAPVAGDDQADVLTWIAQGPLAEDGGAATAQNILQSVNLENPVLYWDSSLVDERYVDYWLIQMASQSMNNNSLRKFAYRNSDNGTSDLCTILSLMPGRTTVRTDSPSLSASLAKACPDEEARVVVRSHG